MMKKVASLLLTLIVCLSCFSCNHNFETNSDGGETQRNTITLSCSDDTSVDGLMFEVGWRENYSFPVPQRDGYIFDCWMYGEERFEASGVWPYSIDATLEARWLLKSYYITYNMAPYYDTASASFTSETDSFMLPTPKKIAGKMFIGWSGSEIDGVKKAVSIPKGSYGDRVYYANWISVDEIFNQLDGFVFEIVGDHAVVTGYCGDYADTLIIPATYKGYPVTVIGDSAFYGMGIFTKLLKIPYSVTVIEDNAIGGCSGLPMAIYNGAFEDWKENITIGQGNGALNDW